MKHMSLLLCLLASVRLFASDPEVQFQHATDLYASGSYDSARVAFEDIVAQHTHFESYYNLGNCYYKLGNMPKAILAYERARLLEPGDEDLEINLTLANSKIQDRIEELDTSGVGSLFERLGSAQALAWYTRLSLLFVILATALLVMRLMKSAGKGRRTYGVLGTLCLLAFGLFLALSIVVSRNINSTQSAIIMEATVDVVNDPGGEEIAFVLHEGSKVKIRQRREGWLYIEIASGDIGWIQETACEVI